MKIPLFPAVATGACAFYLILTSLSGGAAENHFSDWPEGTSPKLIGTRVTERFLKTLKSRADSGKKSEIRYQDVVAWYGALTFAKASGQPELTKALIERATPLLNEETYQIPPPNHVDWKSRGLSLFSVAPSPERADGGFLAGQKALAAG